jgi:hypothetical protein
LAGHTLSAQLFDCAHGQRHGGEWSRHLDSRSDLANRARCRAAHPQNVVTVVASYQGLELVSRFILDINDALSNQTELDPAYVDRMARYLNRLNLQPRFPQMLASLQSGFVDVTSSSEYERTRRTREGRSVLPRQTLTDQHRTA